MPVDSVLFSWGQKSFFYNIDLFFDVVVDLSLLQVYDRDKLILCILARAELRHNLRVAIIVFDLLIYLTR